LNRWFVSIHASPDNYKEARDRNQEIIRNLGNGAETRIWEGEGLIIKYLTLGALGVLSGSFIP
jgi:hypothetical protein